MNGAAFCPRFLPMTDPLQVRILIGVRFWSIALLLRCSHLVRFTPKKQTLNLSRGMSAKFQKQTLLGKAFTDSAISNVQSRTQGLTGDTPPLLFRK
jgi:hypothetical protein